MMYCPRCRSAAGAQSAYCQRCGMVFYRYYTPPPPARKSRGTAMWFAFLLGFVGIHKFYLGRYVQGIFYALFFWTFIPAVMGFVEGIIYACQNDEQFDYIHNRRLN